MVVRYRNPVRRLRGDDDIIVIYAGDLQIGYDYGLEINREFYCD